MVECSYCDNTEMLKSIGPDMVCPECENKGIHKANNNQRKAAEVIDAPININEVMRVSRDIDMSVNLRTDIFNAETTAIIDLKNSIDNDSNVVNKPYALAEELTNRLNHFKRVIFEKNQEIIEANNSQRAIQSYMNTLANQLRAEDREKFRLQDINYSPKPIKLSAITSKRIKQKKSQYAKGEVRKACHEAGVPEYFVAMKMAQNFSLEDAIKSVKKNMAEMVKTNVTESVEK